MEQKEIPCNILSKAFKLNLFFAVIFICAKQNNMVVVVVGLGKVDLIPQDIRTTDTASDWLIGNLRAIIKGIHNRKVR